MSGDDFLALIAALARAAVQPFQDFAGFASDRVSWVYFVSAGAITVGVHLRRQRRWRLRPMLRFCLPRRVLWHRSARADYSVWLLNSVFLVLVMPALWVSSESIADATRQALAQATGVASLGLAPGVPMRLLATAGNLLALDAGLFLAHYLHHRIPLLWEFHKTHHSAAVMTPITVFRVHPVELWINVSIIGSLVGATSGLFAFLCPEPPALLAVNGINLLLFVFFLLGYHLRHSHLWLMFPVPIARHISSPALHLIHHSSDPRHADKNFAQIFNFWDRLAGTLYLPSERERIRFGLQGGEEAEFAGMRALYMQPFRKAWRRLRAYPLPPPLRGSEESALSDER